MFGAGNNETTVRRNMTREIICDRYMQDIYDNASFTDAEKDAYYTEHADSFNRVNFLYAYLTDDAEAKLAEISEKAAGGDEAAFRAAVLEVTEKEATETAYSVTSFLGQYGETVTADELVPGKMFTQTNDAGSYAVYITGLDDNQYNTVSVRHILIKAEDADGDGEYSDSEMEAAYDAVKEIEAQWQAGEATEESFAALAEEKSQDEGSAANGGLYENIYKGQMVEEFDEFCFAGHKKGDTAVVKGSSSSYSGYHLIYFVSADGELYSRVVAEDQLRSEAYNTAIDQLTSGLEAARAVMWRYVMKG
jgi:parvulin-like peptidyl-prolyl isomerase